MGKRGKGRVGLGRVRILPSGTRFEWPPVGFGSVSVKADEGLNDKHFTSPQDPAIRADYDAKQIFEISPLFLQDTIITF